MLLSRTSIVKWNSKIKKHYEDLGYVYTKMGDEFEVNVQHLTRGSKAIVKYQCDYCKNEYEIEWCEYLKKKNKSVLSNDCCKDCLQIKARQGVIEKYHCNNIREVPEINDKIARTNLKKYGCENPFGNKDIQEKIKEFYRENYGVEHNSQVPEIYEKIKQTVVERYGVPYYGAKWQKEHTGQKSPVWKGDDIKHVRTERESPEYRDWRRAVFGRDLHTCQCCGDHSSRGHAVRLEAHHIFNWKSYEDKRYDIDNGITLCQKCHVKYHQIYGKLNNTDIQLKEFMKNFQTKKYAELMENQPSDLQNNKSIS